MKDSFEKTDKVALEGKAFLTDADLEQVAGGNAVPENSILADYLWKLRNEGASEEEIDKAIRTYHELSERFSRRK